MTDSRSALFTATADLNGGRLFPAVFHGRRIFHIVPGKSLFFSIDQQINFIEILARHRKILSCISLCKNENE
jgi:hypothetical protein